MNEHAVNHDAMQPLYDVAKRVMAGAGTDAENALIAARKDGGFHWRFDTYFRRLPDGSVRLRTFHVIAGVPAYTDRTIPAPEWASIVCSVSALGETGERWDAAQDFHGRIRSSGSEG